MLTTRRLQASIAAVAIMGLVAIAGAAPIAADSTSRVKDIKPGSAGSIPKQLTRVGDVLYFTASTKQHGREIWKTKGSALSTRLVKDIKKGQQGSNPDELIAVGDRLFFMANDKIWRTKGTASSTMRLKAPRFWSGLAAALNGKLYWAATSGLWVSGGFQGNTKLLHPVRAGESGFHRVGSKLYFSGRTEAYGRELWVTDGTKAGTKMVADIVPGEGSSFAGGNYFAHVGKTLYFTASDVDRLNGWQLWKSDGTADGTKKLKEFSSVLQPRQLTSMGGALYFAAYRRSDGTELWESDGTPDGTKILKDIYPGSDTGETAYRSSPDELAVTGSKLYFAATDGPHGRELWKSDGTAVGTKLVKDIVKGKTGSHLNSLTAASRGWLFFAAMPRYDGHEPWKSKGTGLTTKRTRDVRRGSKGGMKAYCDDCTAQVGNKVFFVGNDGKTGWELWKWVR